MQWAVPRDRKAHDSPALVYLCILSLLIAILVGRWIIGNGVHSNYVYKKASCFQIKRVAKIADFQPSNRSQSSSNHSLYNHRVYRYRRPQNFALIIPGEILQRSVDTRTVNAIGKEASGQINVNTKLWAKSHTFTVLGSANRGQKMSNFSRFPYNFSDRNPLQNVSRFPDTSFQSNIVISSSK